MSVVTIKDVATRAGVSIGSVSAVINQKAVTSPELRARVLKAIEELGYAPHGGAQSLKGGRTKSIGLLVPDIINPHFAAVAGAIERACDRAGYLLSLGNTLGDLEKEARHLQILRRQRVDGLILDLVGTSEEYVARIRKTITVPTVLIDRRIDASDFDSVTLDNRAAGRLVTEYLLRIGHRRIAIVIGGLEYSTAVERMGGYLDTLADSGIDRDDRLILQGQFDIGPAYQATTEMLSSGIRPTAIFCINNQMTIGVMQALRDQGFRCPQDISVAGVDDLPTATAFEPYLTTAIQPTDQIGQAAVNCVLARLNNTAPSEPVHIVCDPRLIVRGSCRPVDQE
jgi:LacI family transcriptional regulator, galactose operon repressor